MDEEISFTDEDILAPEPQLSKPDTAPVSPDNGASADDMSEQKTGHTPDVPEQENKLRNKGSDQTVDSNKSGTL